VVGLQQLLDHRLLIGGIVNGEVAAQADVVRFAPQQSRAERVERGDPHRAAVHVEQPLDTLAHFLGGLVGEGDRHDLIGVGDALRDEPGDPMRDDARFPGARSSKNQERAVGPLNSFLLLRI
jgi:hypothetical protein